jgi:YVTN family beta-propeller protein
MTKRSLALLLLLLPACRQGVGDGSRGQSATAPAPPAPPPPAGSTFLRLRAPAGNQPATRSTRIDGYNGAILPNGRLLTPVGSEINVDAPKAFGLAVTPGGGTALTINSGSARFSVTLIKDLEGPAAERRARVKRIPLNATFMGVVFSPDAGRYYASGGENGNVWVGDTASGDIIGSVNLNDPTHPLPQPSLANPFPDPDRTRIGSFRGSFPGNMALTQDGRFLYVVDQGNFTVQIVDTSRIVTGVDADQKIVEMNNFAAVVGRTPVGRYPFNITIAPGDRQMYVANVGVFQYSHLIPRGDDRQPGPVGSAPPNPTGVNNDDYPLCYPALAYPDEVIADKILHIKKIDASKISTLPHELQDPEGGIRCGYISGDRTYRVPGLGDPNVDQSSSVYVLDITAPQAPRLVKAIKTGLKVGEVEDGIATFGASHPNAVAVGGRAAYVSNGNNDSISIIDTSTLEVVTTVPLAVFRGQDSHLKGLQPVSLALSPDQKHLYAAEAGINAVAVLSLDGLDARVEGHIPAGWWPSSVKLTADGTRLFVANAKGRGAPPNSAGEGTSDVNTGHPKFSVLASLQVIDVPDQATLARYTERVMTNNGFVEVRAPRIDPGDPIPAAVGTPSEKIKHVIFITKENMTHDLALGDIVRTRQGEPVNGDPRYALGYDGDPNHHELALQFAFGDNFYLEPTVSSDGHRWLVNNPTSEFEETHWPASYGSKRNDAGDNQESLEKWFGRVGFTDANASPDPHDYPQHGTLWAHLDRNGKSFLNFGEGFEFAIVDEDRLTEPTGIREHVNVPMLKVLRDNSDHLYPQFNTAIPDSPLPEDPDRFNRFGRFKQVFEDRFVKDGACTMPSFVNIYYPNDHGGGANDINGAAGPAWDFKRFVQDNDAALGMTIDLLSKSPCWRETVVFVTEDDTQSGLDHVDGYRSLFLAIGPWVKHQYVSHTHISLASIFKTVDLILGMPPLNQYDLAATDLRDLFSTQVDTSVYDFVPPNVTAPKASWARLTRDVDFQDMDRDEVGLRAAIMRSEGLPRKTPKVYRGSRLNVSGTR